MEDIIITIIESDYSTPDSMSGSGCGSCGGGGGACGDGCSSNCN